jgi:hypothetical protein
MSKELNKGTPPQVTIEEHPWLFIETISEDRALEVFHLTRATGEVRRAHVQEPHIVREAGLAVYAVRRKP